MIDGVEKNMLMFYFIFFSYVAHFHIFKPKSAKLSKQIVTQSRTFGYTHENDSQFKVHKPVPSSYPEKRN